MCSHKPRSVFFCRSVLFSISKPQIMLNILKLKVNDVHSLLQITGECEWGLWGRISSKKIFCTAALLVGVRTRIQCSVLGQFEAGFIFEAHVADRSDSTIYAHKSLPTLLWLTCIWRMTTSWIDQPIEYMGDNCAGHTPTQPECLNSEED